MSDPGDSPNRATAAPSEQCQFGNLPSSTQFDVVGRALGDGATTGKKAYDFTGSSLIGFGIGAITAARSFFQRAGQAETTCLGNLQIVDNSEVKDTPRRRTR